jgi:hypothetical protein
MVQKGAALHFLVKFSEKKKGKQPSEVFFNTHGCVRHRTGLGDDRFNRDTTRLMMAVKALPLTRAGDTPFVKRQVAAADWNFESKISKISTPN